MKLAIAAFYYNPLLKPKNGVIEKVELREVKHINALSAKDTNKKSYESMAFLETKHRPKWLELSTLYSNPDGSGTSYNKSEAIYVSISEALERWAFYENCFGPNQEELGFTIDSSTTGMACFPGRFASIAKSIALHEAYERWALRMWWNNYLRIEKIDSKKLGNDDIEAIKIVIPFNSKLKMVVIWKKVSNFFVYGFACRASLKDAIKHARIEMHRTAEALLINTSNNSESISRDLYDKRLLYFSSEKGHSEFKMKVESSFIVNQLNISPIKLVDQEVYGPWSKFCTVWRVLLSLPTSIMQRDREVNEFLF